VGEHFTDATKIRSTPTEPWPPQMPSRHASGRWVFVLRPLGAVSGPRASLCYESFTLKALRSGGSPRTFARVMTGRKPTSRHATRSAFAVRAHSRGTISAAPQFSAQNVLPLTSDLRLLNSDIWNLTFDLQTLPTANWPLPTPASKPHENKNPALPIRSIAHRHWVMDFGAMEHHFKRG